MSAAPPQPHVPAAGSAPPTEAFLTAVVEAPGNRSEVRARRDDAAWPQRLWDAACLLGVAVAAGDPGVADERSARAWMGRHPGLEGAGLEALRWPPGAFARLVDTLGGTGAAGLDALGLLRVTREPGLARVPCVRLRRRDREAVVPEARVRRAPGVEVVERIPEGRFFLWAGHGRKRAGAWYTPKALARRLVDEALAPLVGEAATAGTLLELRLIDPAVGTGAILEAALEALAEALVAARGEAGRRGDARPPLDPAPVAVPEADSGPAPVPDADCGRDRALAAARRDLLTAGVLHGIDLDRVAVEATAWRLALGAGLPRPPEALRRNLVVGDALADPCPVEARSFDAVLGNPPWEVVHPKAKEFFAAHDPGILDAPTRRERAAREAALLEDPAVARAWKAYRAEHADLAFRVRRAFPRSREGGAGVDLWQPFAERAHALARPGGLVGLLLPSAFHANRGGVGLRRLYLVESDPVCCLSFENRARLFDIDSRFKFAVVVVRKRRPAPGGFRCGFYLRHPADRAPLVYDPALLQGAGGAHLTLPELRTAEDLAVLRRLLVGTVSFGRLRARVGLHPGRELDMSGDAGRFVPTEEILPDGEDPREPAVIERLARRGLLPLHEGKTLHQWDDRWGARPRYLAPAEEKAGWRGARGHPRLAWRAVAASTNARTALFAFLPPGVACGNSAIVERTPWPETRGAALALAALANAYVFDWALRVRNGANVNLFILDACPVPDVLPDTLWRFLVHGAVRLSCTHTGFSGLWRDVMGGAWREAGPRMGWPAVAGPARVALIDALDAAVAHAYGLDPALLAHVLGGFRHSDPQRPARVLSAFRELLEAPEAWLRGRDPYADRPVPGIGWGGAAPATRVA